MHVLDLKKVADVVVLLEDVDTFRSSYREAVEDGLPTARHWRQRLLETEAELRKAEQESPFEVSQARLRRMLHATYYR